MTNSLRGAVSFEVAGDPMSLAITTNAMVRYQDAAGETFLTGLTALQKDPSDVKRIRTMVWSAMAHVPGMTHDRAGDIMDAVGIFRMAAILGEAANLAFPADEPGNVEGARKRPPNSPTIAN